MIPEKFADNMQSPGVIAWHKPVPALGFDLRLVVFMGMVPSPVVVVLEVLHLDNQRNGAAR